MFRAARWRPVAAVITAALLSATVLGCGEDATAPPPTPQPTSCSPIDSVACDFTLTDVNPGSPTSLQDISPRQFLGEVSAWYFGHST